MMKQLAKKCAMYCRYRWGSTCRPHQKESVFRAQKNNISLDFHEVRVPFTYMFFYKTTLLMNFLSKGVFRNAPVNLTNFKVERERASCRVYTQLTVLCCQVWWRVRCGVHGGSAGRGLCGSEESSKWGMRKWWRSQVNSHDDTGISLKKLVHPHHLKHCL